MGVHVWPICRLEYGENFSVAAAVTAINPGYRFSTLARFREALDALVGGMRKVKSPTSQAANRASRGEIGVQYG
jgi:hypothetical protein